MAKILLQQIDQDADQQHPEDVPHIGLLDPVELVFEEGEAANKAGRSQTGNHAENCVKEQQ